MAREFLLMKSTGFCSTGSWKKNYVAGRNKLVMLLMLSKIQTAELIKACFRKNGRRELLINQILEHQTAFYEATLEEARIGTRHIYLYLALYNTVGLVYDELNEVNRDRLMQNARISRKIYNKCMKELHEYGYIKYEPSSNP